VKNKVIGWIVAILVVAFIAGGIGLFFAAMVSGCCSCPEPGQELDIDVLVEDGWDTPMEFWAVMYVDCIEFVDVYEAWAIGCGYEAQEDTETCLTELWGRGVGNLLCSELTRIYIENIATGWCHPSNHSPREDHCW
jgi:hypothetical protein